jgi:hypothetical protein
MNTTALAGVHAASGDVPSLSYGQLANCGDFRVMEALSNIADMRDMQSTQDDTPVTLGDLIISSPMIGLPNILKLFPIRHSVACYFHNALVIRVYHQLMELRERSILLSPHIHDLIRLQNRDLNYLTILMEKIKLNEERGRASSSTEFSDIVADIICRGFYPSVFSEKSDKLHNSIFDILQRNRLPLSATHNVRINSKLTKRMKTRSFRSLREAIVMRYNVSGYHWFHETKYVY